MNVARNKKIMERDTWANFEIITNGEILKYDGKDGYAHATIPNYCTLDLEEIYEIKQIRLLLWDKDDRNYKYRLLVSDDMISWNVLYDTGKDSGQSWQNFELQFPLRIRYIRIHGLYNSVPTNNKFHIVELEAYENVISIPNTQDVKIIKTEDNQIELSDGLPVSSKMFHIVNKLKEFPEIPGLDKKYFTGIASELEKSIYDVKKIEIGMDAIKRQIIEPVNNELSRSNRIGKISLSLGIVGGIVGIFSLINSIFEWI